MSKEIHVKDPDMLKLIERLRNVLNECKRKRVRITPYIDPDHLETEWNKVKGRHGESSQLLQDVRLCIGETRKERINSGG